MKTLLNIAAIGIAALLVSHANAADGPPPKGWGGTPMDEYKRGTDPEMVRNGKPSAFIQSVKGNPGSFGTMTQGFSAADYVGKRVQLKGFVKTQNVSGTGAGLWLRIDDANKKPLQFDNMEKRSVKGTSDWTEVSIVVDVPATSDSFMIGVLLAGEGRMWINSLSFEVVDNSVPVTSEFKNAEPRRKPANLGFTD